MDEFQNFTTDAFSHILSEARKYKLNIILANQFMSQLDNKIQEAVLGNIGTLCVFRVGSTDAERLAKEFYPYHELEDLHTQDNFSLTYRKVENSALSRPALTQALPPIQWVRRAAKKKKRSGDPARFMANARFYNIAINITILQLNIQQFIAPNSARKI